MNKLMKEQLLVTCFSVYLGDLGLITEDEPGIQKMLIFNGAAKQQKMPSLPMHVFGWNFCLRAKGKAEGTLTSRVTKLKAGAGSTAIKLAVLMPKTSSEHSVHVCESLHGNSSVAAACRVEQMQWTRGHLLRLIAALKSFALLWWGGKSCG